MEEEEEVDEVAVIDVSMLAASEPVLNVGASCAVSASSGGTESALLASAMAFSSSANSGIERLDET